MPEQAISTISQKSFAVVIPAYNEEASIGQLIVELREYHPTAKVIVVSDGSVDKTAVRASEQGATVLDLPCNLGVGGAVQAGLRYACDLGYDVVARIDGDGQHPPSEISKLLETLERTGSDLVVASRFLGDSDFQGGTVMRQAGNVMLSWFLSLICRTRVTDPTCGFWCVQGELLHYFSHDYPCEYPEPEALALLRRQGYTMTEVGVSIRPRAFGVSTIDSLGTVYFALRVGLALLADRVRPVDRRFAKTNRQQEDRR